MTKTEELRHEVDKLEETVRNAVQKFYDEIGTCDINISVDRLYMKNVLGEKKMFNTEVKINVII